MAFKLRKLLRKKLSAVATAAAKPRAKRKKPAKPAPAAPAAVPVPAEVLRPGDPIQGVLRAAAFAARKHQGQKRNDGQTPYFSHVARVAFILSHVFGVRDEAVLTAAYLHDTLEDTATDYDELEEHFGPQVADYVVALTKNVMLPKKKREAEYEARLIAAPEAVKIAKMADLYDNLSDRVNSPKITKTSATAERLLAAFAEGLETDLGRTAHGKVSRLLEQIEHVRG